MYCQKMAKYQKNISGICCFSPKKYCLTLIFIFVSENLMTYLSYIYAILFVILSWSVEVKQKLLHRNALQTPSLHTYA